MLCGLARELVNPPLRARMLSLYISRRNRMQLEGVDLCVEADVLTRPRIGCV